MKKCRGRLPATVDLVGRRHTHGVTAAAGIGTIGNQRLAHCLTHGQRFGPGGGRVIQIYIWRPGRRRAGHRKDHPFLLRRLPIFW